MKSTRIAAVASILLTYVLLSAQTISFRMSPDLGRLLADGHHLLNGNAQAVLHSNYYSYAAPHALFINHHWLGAIVFALLFEALGAVGLNVAYLALGAIAVLIFAREASRRSDGLTAWTIAMLAMPLLATRPGVRPEVFTLLMSSLFLLVIGRVLDGALRLSWLWLLVPLEALWANLHPGFVLGPVLLGCYILALRDKRWLIPGVGVALAGLANPNFVRGWLLPLTVSANYEMPVRENLSVFKLSDVPLSYTLEIAVLAFAVSAWWAKSKRVKLDVGLLLFTALLGVGALAFFRVYVFFAVFGLVAVAGCVRISSKWVAATGVGVGLVAMLVNIEPRWSSVGFGVREGDSELADFLKPHLIQRVFNGYSTGSYLIHHFPDKKVFIDSRPEAYPQGFIQNDYLDALENEAAWKRSLEKYNFDAIVFAQFNADEAKFLLRRIQDPEWTQVHEGASIVLLRKSSR